MDEQDVNVTVTYTINSHVLTITYVTPDGVTAPTQYSQSYNYGSNYSVTSPTIEHYTPDVAVVSGTMDEQDVNVTVTYTINSYTVTYAYTGEVPAGAPAVPTAAEYNYHATVPAATVPTLEGYTFHGWEGEVTTMPANNVNVTGYWTINQYTVTAQSANTTMGSATGTSTVDYLTNVTLTATANYGYHFVNWTNNNGDILGTETTITVQALRDSVITANFGHNSYTVTASTNPLASGTIEGTGNYDYLETCTLTATPATGYYFVNWTEGSTVMSTSTTYSFEVTDSKNLVANFDTLTYNLAASVNPAESGTVEGTGTYKHFKTATLTAIPANGYHFEQWNDGITDSLRVINLTRDSSFTAYFAPNSYTITYMDEETELNVDTFDYHRPITEYSISKEGWTFIGWSPSVPELMPAENLTVYAQWHRICSSVTDFDNNTYPTVNIGNICWMAANMRATHYADGREVANIYEYVCNEYPNATENVNIYGRLYDWYDATDASRPTRSVRIQGICPEGWFLPNEEDFELLSNMELQTLRSTDYWLFNPGDNSSGFDLRPAGMYNFANARYENLLGNAYLWSATTDNITEAHCHMADCHCYMLIDLIVIKQNAMSVRCVRE